MVRFPFFVGLRYVSLIGKSRHFISFISIASLLGVALSTAALITVLSVMNGFEKEVRDKIFELGAGISISSWYDGELYDWQQVIEIVEQKPYVSKAYPIVAGQAMLLVGKQMKAVSINGIYPAGDYSGLKLEAMVNNPADSEIAAKLTSGSFNLVLGDKLARNLGLKVGDKVPVLLSEIEADLFGVKPRIKQCKVVATFKAGYIYDSYYAYMHIDDAKKLFKLGDEVVSSVVLNLQQPMYAPIFAQHLDIELGQRYYVTDWTKIHKEYFSMAKTEKGIMFVVLSLLIGIASFNLVSTLVMIVTDKRYDIALLRVMGLSVNGVMIIFVVQGLIIGLLGLLLGVCLGWLLANNVTALAAFLEWLFNAKIFASELYFIDYVPSEIAWQDIIYVALISLFLAFLSTLYPAFKAAKVKPVEALNYGA